MALRTSHFAIIALPILSALLFAAWQRQEAVNLDESMFEDTPALELLQRSAKVTHMKNAAPTLAPMVQGRPIHTTTTGKAEKKDIGVSANGVGNLPIFITGIITDLVIMFVFFIWFVVASRNYKIIYEDNKLKGLIDAPVAPGLFGFAVTSYNMTLDQCWTTAGLDHAMMLEYLSICTRCMKWIALPMFFIMGPLNCAFGGNAAGQDHESWFSMGNVEFFCWLYWPIGFAIIYVAWCVTDMCNKAMRDFLPRRFEWLRAMEKKRANTIMMVGIPEKYQSDQACKAFWDELLPGGKVESVNLAKDTTWGSNIQSLVKQMNDAKHQLSLAEATWEKENKDPDKRPTCKASYFGSPEDAIDYWNKEIEKFKPQVKAAKDELDKEAKTIGSPNLSAGFVTFKNRMDAEVALRMDLDEDINSWVMDYPPQPADVIWADLTQDPTAEGSRKFLGYALTAGIVIIYMPLVVFICNVAELINLGPLQPIWSSEAPSMGLTIMVDFLPTILMTIFSNCFSLYDKTQAQFKLSVWYWWMNVLYVVCVTALGTNFLSFAETLAKDPLSLFGLLADTMPECTHYYMNYIGLNFVVHSMVLARYVPLIKYRNALRNHSEQEAKNMAEPEDQDYYGIGSRTARWSTMMCIGIVYGTLSPPVSLLTLGLFGWMRIVYGYNFTYAETKKSDLGGIFFCRALHNTYTSLHIYMVLMLGVFFQRASNMGPVIVVAVGWVFVFIQQKKFNEYKWERLPYTELVDKKPPTRVQELKGSYVQPELTAE